MIEQIKSEVMGYAIALGAVIDHVASTYNPAGIEAWLTGVDGWLVAGYAGLGVAWQAMRRLFGG